MACIYKQSESGYFYAQVLNGDGTPANSATVTLTVYKSDNSKYVDAQAMTYITGSNGMYKYAFTAPATVGRMVADVSSTSPTAYGTEDIYVGQWTDDINSIKAKTDLIGASVALESAGNLEAVKAKTDLIPADITTQLDTNVPAIKAKTDLLPADTATQLDTNIPAIKAKTDLIPADIATQIDTNIPAILADTGTDGVVIPQAQADKVWGTATRALTDKAGFTISGTKTTLDALNDISTAQVAAEADEALVDYAPALETTAQDIKAKTGNLPSDPADESLLEAALVAIYNSVALRALETTLTAIKGAGWTAESLKAIKDAIDALVTGGATAQEVWEYVTRTLTATPESFVV